MSIDLNEYGKRLREIADYCTKNGRNDKIDGLVIIPSLNTFQDTLNVIEAESKDMKTKQESQLNDILSNISNDIFDYHTSLTKRINQQLTFVCFFYFI